MRRISGTLTSVSTLLIAVGLPNSPTSTGNGGLLRGSGRPPSIDSNSAVSSPTMYAPAPTRSSMSKDQPLPATSSPRRPAALACASAPSSRSRASGYSPRRYRYPRDAPTANPSIVIASSSANGSSSRITRSLNVPGSDSSALQTTYFGVAGWAATAAHLRPVGNAAPPRPTSFAAVTASMTAGAPIVDRLRERLVPAGRAVRARATSGPRDRRARAAAARPARPAARGRGSTRSARPALPGAPRGRAPVPRGPPPRTSRACRRRSPAPSSSPNTSPPGSGPATVTSIAGARSHWPRHGLRSHVASPSARGAPGSPNSASRSAQMRSAPASRQAMSSHTWATIGARGASGRQRIERGDAVRIGGRHGEPLRDVVQGAAAHPAFACGGGVQRREQEIAAGPRLVAAARAVAVERRVPRRRPPSRSAPAR